MAISEEERAHVNGYYTDDQYEFIRAVEQFQHDKKCPFPRHTDYLAVAKTLGYHKDTPLPEGDQIMPKKDGTGPRSGSQGPRDGKGKGKGQAKGKGTGSKTGGKKGPCK